MCTGEILSDRKLVRIRQVDEEHDRPHPEGKSLVVFSYPTNHQLSICVKNSPRSAYYGSPGCVQDLSTIK